MSEDELEILVTLDDPWYASEEDAFDHLHSDSNVNYWLGERFEMRPHDDDVSS